MAYTVDIEKRVPAASETTTSLICPRCGRNPVSGIPAVENRRGFLYVNDRGLTVYRLYYAGVPIAGI